MPVFGIGKQRMSGEKFGARHFSLLLTGMQVAPFKKVLPLICKNALCVNPDHLVTGDKALFLMKIQKLSEKNGGCWVWTGTLDRRGYGVIQLSEPIRHQVKAHRYSWELFTGRPVPSSRIQVCHTCDHPYCVNPHHLFLGTNQDNIDDKAQKGRAARKLNIISVREIKTLLGQGELSQTEIANMYNVSLPTIYDIGAERTWRKIE